MADIKQYTDAIANAVYGEEVRGSIINALNKVNDDNNKYQDIKEEVVAANDAVQEAVQQFDGKVAAAETVTQNLQDTTSAAQTTDGDLKQSITKGGQTKQDLDNNIQIGNALMKDIPNLMTEGTKVKEDLGSAVQMADSHKSQLDDSNAAAGHTNTTLQQTISGAGAANTTLGETIKAAGRQDSNLKGSIQTGSTMKDQLDQSTSAGQTAKDNLDQVIPEAQTAKQQLDDSKAAADLSKKNLDGSKSAADTSKTQLDGSIKTAGTTKGELDQSIQTAKDYQDQIQSSISQGNETEANIKNAIQAAGETQTALEAANDAAVANQTELDTRNQTAVKNLADLKEAEVKASEILVGVEDIKAYLGYPDTDIAGVQVDFKNKSYQRLAGAYGLLGGADFNTFPMFGGRKKCNVADDGTIKAWFGDPEYKEDGSNGQVMVYQPKFYYKVVPLVIEPISGGTGYHLRKVNYYVSDKPKDGFKLHPAFYDEEKREIDYFLDSAYEGCIFDSSAAAYLLEDEQVMSESEDKFSSIGDARPASGWKQGLTRTAVEAMARKRGKGWHSQLIKQESAVQMLTTIELGTMNFQTAVGQGVVSLPWTTGSDTSSTYAARTGSTASLGNGTGQAESTKTYPGGVETVETASGKTSVVWRGKENPWGNLYRVINGVSIYGNGSQGGGHPYICEDFNFAESKNSGNYVDAGFQLTPKSGYISAMGYSEAYDWLFMPSECLGNGSVPVGDYTYVSENLNGYRIVRLGGYWNNGGSAGSFYWYLIDGVGYRARNVGGRLVYIPSKSSPIHDTNVAAWAAKMSA